MYIDDPVKRNIADKLLLSDLSAKELANAVGYDFDLLSYLAYSKAQQFQYKSAIDLVRLGAHCGTVLGVLHFNAPDLLQSCLSARDYFFEQRFLGNPSAWKSERSRQKALLEGVLLESTSQRQYSDQQVEAMLIEDGYGFNLAGSV